MNVYLIRHGRQCSPLCNVNVSLSEAGHEQAKLVGERLKSYGIEGLYSSEFIRARETAQEIGEKIGLEYTVISGIQEIDYGEWEGHTEADLDRQYPELRNAHRLGLQDITYPGGENGRGCYERFRKGMESILLENYENVAVVTHGVAIRCFLTGILGMPFEKRGLLARTFENTSITQVVYDKEHQVFRLEQLNDYAHLDGHEELLRKYYINPMSK